jgi:hypothetical protein
VSKTTHAKDGLHDVAAAMRTGTPPASAKKRVRAGDLLVSRLRPYLRQIALVTEDVAAACKGRPLACSTEFYVLTPATDEGGSPAYLLAWLLDGETQAHLAAAQEGGHHPRVPRETLFAMRVPQARVTRAARASVEIERALASIYAAHDALRKVLR